MPFGVTPSAPAAGSETDPLALLKANNLSDLANAGTARSNLGLGTAAVAALASLLQAANNLSELANAATARSNLGLGSAATLASSAVAQTANNLSDLSDAAAARTNLSLDNDDIQKLASIQPPDGASSMIGWTFDPQFGASTLTMTAGTLYLATIKLAKTSPISNVIIPLSGGGAGTTASYVVVYNFTTGARLGVSADQGTAWTSAGAKNVALSTPTSPGFALMT